MKVVLVLIFIIFSFSSFANSKQALESVNFLIKQNNTMKSYLVEKHGVVNLSKDFHNKGSSWMLQSAGVYNHLNLLKKYLLKERINELRGKGDEAKALKIELEKILLKNNGAD